MTIIQPNKKNGTLSFLIISFTGGIVAISLWGIFLYNEGVSARHDTRTQEVALRTIEVENSELKNTVYRMTDQKNLEGTSTLEALVLEKTPRYIKTSYVAEKTIR